jgi:feruloyl esterase
MKILRRLLWATLVTALHSPAWAAMDCTIEALKVAAPAGVEITKASRETAEATEYCAVEGTMVTSNNQLRFRLGLPKDWNGKFLYEAPGGGAGLLVDVRTGVKRHYAVATSDTGHVGFTGDFEFWVNKEQVTDWVHRGVHAATVGAKVLVEKYYARAPERSLLRGCSNGGRAGLMEAQRYPTDYDGIIAAAPAADAGLMTVNWIWDAQVLQATPLSPDDWRLVGRTVRAACDAKDGLMDGLIQDDRRCELPRDQLACTAARGTDCLDAPKLAALEKLWNKPVLSDGRRLPSEGRGYEDEAPAQSFYAGAPALDLWRMLVSSSSGPAGNNFGTHQMEPGPPLSFVLPWLVTGAPSAVAYTAQAYARGLLLPGRSVDVRTFDVVKDGPQLSREETAVVDVTHDPDLSTYLRRGSKLLLWHGLADVTLAPGMTYAYFEAARDKAIRSGYAADQFDRQVRLYTSPTTGHCGGGSGPNEGDLLGALDEWVVGGKTPEAVTVLKRGDDGRVVRSRLLCPMPQEPRYVGKGSIDDAASFVCAIPADRVGMTGLAKPAH